MRVSRSATAPQYAIRDYALSRPPEEGGRGREWRVELPGPDGKPRTVVFADRVMPRLGPESRMVTAFVQQIGKPGDGAPLSRRRANAPGSTDGGFEPPPGYRRGPFDQQPQGQEPPAGRILGARTGDAQKNPAVRAAENAAAGPLARVQDEVAAGRLGKAELAELRAAGEGVQAADSEARVHAAAAACLVARGAA